MAMTNKQKKSKLNRMGFVPYVTKLGDLMPITVKKTLASGDVSSSKTTIDMGFDVTAVTAVLVLTSSGAPRVITKIAVNSAGTGVEVTATDLAATDVVTVTAV